MLNGLDGPANGHSVIHLVGGGDLHWDKRRGTLRVFGLGISGVFGHDHVRVGDGTSLDWLPCVVHE